VILCAGLSPAWQHTLFFDRFEFGEVNRARKGVWCASGKVVNAAAALASLGVKHRMLSIVGGWTEETFRRDLEASGVEGESISVQAPTRVCTTMLVNGQPTTELVEECGPLSSDEIAEFESRLIEQLKSATALVIAGSIPKGTDVRLWRRVLEQTSGPAVLDFRGPELLEALGATPLLVKPNREELGATVGRTLASEQKVIEAAKEICCRGAQWVLITHGNEPALLVGQERVVRVHAVSVQPLNPIGCGDTLAATIAWRVSEGDGVPEAVRWGIAAAAANAETELPARFRRARFEELLSQVGVE
jgi:tagatose 6-phosphate kinase